MVAEIAAPVWLLLAAAQLAAEIARRKPAVQPQAFGGQSQPQVAPQPATTTPAQQFPQPSIPQAIGQAPPAAATQQNGGADTKPATTPNGPVTLQLSPGSLTPSQG